MIDHNWYKITSIKKKKSQHYMQYIYRKHTTKHKCQTKPKSQNVEIQV